MKRTVYHTIGTTAATLGITSQCVRNYDARGTIKRDAETADGRPLYLPATVAKLQQVLGK